LRFNILQSLLHCRRRAPRSLARSLNPRDYPQSQVCTLCLFLAGAARPARLHGWSESPKWPFKLWPARKTSSALLFCSLLSPPAATSAPRPTPKIIIATLRPSSSWHYFSKRSALEIKCPNCATLRARICKYALARAAVF
jgi:hypothetical protein